MDIKLMAGENPFNVKKILYLQFSGSNDFRNYIMLKEMIKAECGLKKGEIISTAFLNNEIEVVAEEGACYKIINYLVRLGLKHEQDAFDQDDPLSTARFAREVAKRHSFVKKYQVASVQRF